jgi:hypothetical protein
VRAAELALGHAKRLGRNRVEVAPTIRSRGNYEPPTGDTTTH